MSISSSPSYPRRRSLVAWSLLALLMVVTSYAITLSLAAACLYVPYLILTNISFGLQTIVLGACGLAMGLTILWSLAPRRNKAQAPGPRIEARDHPRLFAEIQGVAKALNEPMPQDVYLTGDVNAFVAQFGGLLGIGSRRVMGVGLPLMQVLTVPQFRAVLAHEFAHYYSGDTRLGPWVYSSRATMARTLRSLTHPSAALRTITRVALAAVVYYVVTNLLVAYWKIFLRATQLVSRRQEYRADELACHAAGSQAFIDGLRGIHAAGPALAAYWTEEVVPALQNGYLPPVSEGFSRFLSAPRIAKDVADSLEQELRKPHTNPYDSHPPLRDRIAAAQRVPSGLRPADDSLSPATTLINDLPAMEARLLDFIIQPKLDVPALKRVGWDAVGSASVLPALRTATQEFSDLLSRVAVDSLPETAKDLRSLGSRMPDPKGMLLTREQRDGRAVALLVRALTVLLADKGWELHAQPGEFYLSRGSQRAEPVQLIEDLAAGKVTREAWIEQCRSLGIAGSSLLTAADRSVTPASKLEPA